MLLLLPIVFGFDPQQNPSPAFCNSSLIVKFLQTLQLERARDELGMKKSSGYRPDLDFYSYSYGVTTVDGVGSETAIKTVSGPSLIIYYDIYQNANKYIQSLLRNFADVLAFHYREYSAYLDVTEADEANQAYVPFKVRTRSDHFMSPTSSLPICHSAWLIVFCFDMCTHLFYFRFFCADFPIESHTSSSVYLHS